MASLSQPMLNSEAFELRRKEARQWMIVGREGLCDDFGFCEPDAAACEIRRREDSGEHLTEQEIEQIARNYHCHVVWGRRGDPL